MDVHLWALTCISWYGPPSLCFHHCVFDSLPLCRVYNVTIRGFRSSKQGPKLLSLRSCINQLTAAFLHWSFGLNKTSEGSSAPVAAELSRTLSDFRVRLENEGELSTRWAWSASIVWAEWVYLSLMYRVPFTSSSRTDWNVLNTTRMIPTRYINKFSSTDFKMLVIEFTCYKKVYLCLAYLKCENKVVAREKWRGLTFKRSKLVASYVSNSWFAGKRSVWVYRPNQKILAQHTVVGLSNQPSASRNPVVYRRPFKANPIYFLDAISR